MTRVEVVVRRAGMASTFQDLGRGGWAHLGVPRSGAADRWSLIAANRLVGNADTDAALEIVAFGPALVFEADAQVALAGAAVDATLDGRGVPGGCVIEAVAGSNLDLGAVRNGARAYLAIAGGFAPEPTLGSRSYDSLSHLGPPPLNKGDRIAGFGAAAPRASAWMRGPAEWDGLVPPPKVVKALEGPDAPWACSGSASEFWDRAWTVLADSDRTGVRLAPLDGRPIGVDSGAGSVASKGMVPGAVQLPPSGMPVVLLANHGTTGGYPVIAVVSSADLSQVGQLLPGDEISFRPTSLRQARSAFASRFASLQGELKHLGGVVSGALPAG